VSDYDTTMAYYRSQGIDDAPSFCPACGDEWDDQQCTSKGCGCTRCDACEEPTTRGTTVEVDGDSVLLCPDCVRNITPELAS
jgi:hypothetical protein